jgi:hypothetical protein
VNRWRTAGSAPSLAGAVGYAPDPDQKKKKRKKEKKINILFFSFSFQSLSQTSAIAEHISQSSRFYWVISMQ